MDKKAFSAILGLLVPQVVAYIAENMKEDELSATNQFYRSKVYTLLEDESTKMWHFSPRTLFMLFEEEKQFGTFTIPEEG